MTNATLAYRGRLISISPLGVDGQRLYRSERNGNYYVGFETDGRRIMLSVRDACGWLVLHGQPQHDDTAKFYEVIQSELQRGVQS